MLDTLIRQRYGLLRWWAALLSIFLVTGCASTLSARVTSFEKWPAQSQGQTYRIVPDADQGNNLEFQSFADMIRASLGPTGLVEATNGRSARFDVSFTYGNPVTQVWVQRSGEPYNAYGPMFGPAWGYYGGGGYWGGGVYFPPPVVNVPMDVHKNTLTVRIKDNQQHGAEVYRSSAVNITSSDNLLGVMPYLARAVFDGFPGNNGQVRNIKFELPRH